MNNYRVDRADSASVPCGMNSILYLGDNWAAAQKVYDNAVTGLDAWNQPNSRYGVILSVWNGQRLTGDYVVKCMKGLLEAAVLRRVRVKEAKYAFRAW